MKAGLLPDGGQFRPPRGTFRAMYDSLLEHKLLSKYN